jgi:hypothetical protein
MQFLVVPISISIMLIALTSYLRFRNWRLLFLSVAFLLLAIPPTLNLLASMEVELGLSPWTVSELLYASFIFSTASVLPFAILAYIYFNERKNQSITITRPQWAFGGLLLLAEVGFIIFILLTNFGYTDLSSAFSTWQLLSLLNFISSSVAYVLIILIVISLFSYYKAKKKKNTLVVMMGFVCFLFSQGYGIFNYFLYTLANPNVLGFGLVLSLQLAGYIAFLAALLRLKVFR